MVTNPALAKKSRQAAHAQTAGSAQKGKKKKKQFSIRNLISTLLMLVAIGALFYPIVVNWFVGQQDTKTVQTFKNATSSLSAAQIGMLVAGAQLYNNYIYDMSQHIVWNQPVPDYNKMLAVTNNGMMGYITIPQIAVNNVPIYHGDSAAALDAGVGHIPQTSLPIGGINTHSVLSAHSGRVNNTLFTDLDKLKLGDVFTLQVLNLQLKYQIDNIKIVNPDQVDSLNIVPGKDLVTLVTCYPTGINSQRLLVTGERIPYKTTLPQEKIQRNQYGYNFWVMAGSALLALTGALYALWRLLIAGKRRKRYSLTDESKRLGTVKLYRIKALKDFGDVKKGDLGGWVQSEKNLAQKGTAWIYDDSAVLEKAQLLDNAKISRGATLSGKEKVGGRRLITGESPAEGNEESEGSSLEKEN